MASVSRAASSSSSAAMGLHREDIGKLVLRLTLGVLMLLHGLAKLTSGPGMIVSLIEKQGLPSELGYLVYVGEVIAPLLVIAGIWTRAAAAVMAINMVVAVLLVHAKEIFMMGRMGGWALELQGLFLFGSLALALLGAGRYSFGGARGRWN